MKELFGKIAQTLTDAADGLRIMYEEGYVALWGCVMGVFLIGIIIGWGLRSSITFTKEED